MKRRTTDDRLLDLAGSPLPSRTRHAGRVQVVSHPLVPEVASLMAYTSLLIWLQDLRQNSL